MFPKKKWMRHEKTVEKSSGNPRECTVKTLDQWFSRYIRLRDTNGYGVCQCITCSSHGHPKDFDCGHFVHRDRWGTRYAEHNVAAQCTHCNSFEGGQQALMARRLDERHGPHTAEVMQALGTRSGKLKGYERYLLCQEYKAKVKVELVRTGLEPWWKYE